MEDIYNIPHLYYFLLHVLWNIKMWVIEYVRVKLNNVEANIKINIEHSVQY